MEVFGTKITNLVFQPHQFVKVMRLQATGTTVKFWPSKEIFETTDFSFEVLSTRFREMAFLNKGLILTLTDLRQGHVDEKGEHTNSSISIRRRELLILLNT